MWSILESPYFGKLPCFLLRWDNGTENGNYYSMLGLYWDNGKEQGYYYSLYTNQEKETTPSQFQRLGFSVHPLNPKAVRFDASVNPETSTRNRKPPGLAQRRQAVRDVGELQTGSR